MSQGSLASWILVRAVFLNSAYTLKSPQETLKNNADVRTLPRTHKIRISTYLSWTLAFIKTSQAGVMCSLF